MYFSSVSDFPKPILILILILIQATQAGRWLILCQPVVHRLLSYRNDNGYDKHLRSQTDLLLFENIYIYILHISWLDMSPIALEICGVSPKYAELDFCLCIKIMWDIF